jgi:hypothetical protein
VPAEDVLFALQSDLEALRACLPESGSIQLGWTIDSGGESSDFHVKWTTLERTSAERALQLCLSPRIQQRHFELPTGASEGSATWTFVKELPLEHGKKRKSKSAKRRGRGVEFDPPGSLPAEEVDGIVQSGMKLYAHCLRTGVMKQSDLHGRLSLSWQVDADGKAQSMYDAGSDLKDQDVIDCAAECFYALRFPEPTAAPVRVTYSLLLNED